MVWVELVSIPAEMAFSGRPCSRRERLCMHPSDWPSPESHLQVYNTQHKQAALLMVLTFHDT